MNEKSTSVRFMEWVLARIQEEAGDMLREGELFDERKMSLQTLMDRPLKELAGMSCLVSFPKMQHASGEPEDSRMHVISVLVYIRCKPTLTRRRGTSGELESFALADKLYGALDAQHFERDANVFTANVTTSKLVHQTEKDTGLEHLFEVTATITI